MRIYSTLELPPTDRQVRAITKMCITLKISEPLEESVSNRMEARNLMYQLRGQIRAMPRKVKPHS